eukprot:1177212-Prorocentrum_minimum.AAC.3
MNRDTGKTSVLMVEFTEGQQATFATRILIARKHHSRGTKHKFDMYNYGTCGPRFVQNWVWVPVCYGFYRKSQTMLLLGMGPRGGASSETSDRIHSTRVGIVNCGFVANAP